MHTTRVLYSTDKTTALRMTLGGTKLRTFHEIVWSRHVGSRIFQLSKFIRLSGRTLEYIALEPVTSYERASESQRRVVGRYPILKGNTNSNEISGSPLLLAHFTRVSLSLSLFPKSPQEKTTEQKSDDAARIVRTSGLKKLFSA